MNTFVSQEDHVHFISFSLGYETVMERLLDRNEMMLRKDRESGIIRTFGSSVRFTCVSYAFHVRFSGGDGENLFSHTVLNDLFFS